MAGEYRRVLSLPLHPALSSEITERGVAWRKPRHSAVFPFSHLSEKLSFPRPLTLPHRIKKMPAPHGALRALWASVLTNQGIWTFTLVATSTSASIGCRHCITSWLSAATACGRPALSST